MVRVKSQSERRLEILHELDEMFDGLRELRQNFSYFDMVVKSGIRQQYVKGQLSLVLNLEIRCEGNDVRRPSFSRSAVSSKYFTAIILHNNVVNSGSWPQTEKNQMLVRDVEFVKDVNNSVVLPSFVRLYIGNEQVEDSRIRPGVYVNPIERTFKVFRRRVDRKLSPVEIGSRDVILKHGNPSEIECGSKIVDCISDDQSDVIGVFGELQRVYKFIRASVVIFLDSNSTTFLQRENCSLQVCDMLIGPLDFEMSVFEKVCATADGKAANICD